MEPGREGWWKMRECVAGKMTNTNKSCQGEYMWVGACVHVRALKEQIEGEVEVEIQRPSH